MVFMVWDDGDWEDEDEKLWDADYDLSHSSATTAVTK
ncbi:MAG: hypothetical protein H6Q65_1344 [Firmicutes bacterium]|nr:hypothetical protein [Bacillota bacterium]